jgi:hypothetical protein
LDHSFEGPIDGLLASCLGVCSEAAYQGEEPVMEKVTDLMAAKMQNEKEEGTRVPISFLGHTPNDLISFY